MGEAKRRRARPPKPAPLKVAIAYVHDDDGRVTAFEESLLGLLTHDAAHERYLNHDHGRMPIRYGTDGLVAARNTVVAALLSSDVDYLLWVDTDMGFAPDSLYRLLEWADPAERPIVGALAFIQRQFATDGLNGYRTRPAPTIFAWLDDEEAGAPRFTSVPLYPVNTVLPCAATGSAFVLIHRSAFERIAQTVVPGTDIQIGPRWYDRERGALGELLGEDISLCMKAALAGVPVHVHTGVKTSHFKSRWLSEVDHWRSYIPPPATDEVAVIVPTLRRPQNAKPFMTSLRASTGLATAYAVCDLDDPESIRAWGEAGAQVIIGDVVTFAKKANLGYAKTSEPWLFLAGDDVKFHAGWLDHAQHVAQMLSEPGREVSVVGTNDLGNPRVIAGDHATHMLVRRSYVDQVGASWDGPGVVAHEGYRHWSVDDEIVQAARRRGVWQMALGSVVEHNHPFWGKAEDDDTYQVGQSFAEQDRALYQQRLAANTGTPA